MGSTLVNLMKSKIALVNGRIKEAAGVLTGSDKLRRQGKAGQTIGKVKRVVQKTADTVRKAVRNMFE